MADTSRGLALQVLYRVIVEKRSLTSVVKKTFQGSPAARDQAFVKALCYGTLRWYFRLDFILNEILHRPLKSKHNDIRILALLGLFQLGYTRVEPYAAISETVSAVGKKTWAKPLLNRVLRTYQRSREQFDRLSLTDTIACAAHPQWLVDRISKDWPDEFENIMHENNQQPPMTLRVNRLRLDSHQYLEMLKVEGIKAIPAAFCIGGITLSEAMDVSRLPGFDKGLVSVQDGAAQQAASLLNLKPGHRVLDVCAAPGGKTVHLLEFCPDIGELVAVDIDKSRMQRVGENLRRAGLAATLIVGDATDPATWWDGGLYDRILVDAPCSATGVIRRHPDIKLLRLAEDLSELVETQRLILEKLWPMLKRGGILLYATCSILNQENGDQITRFLAGHQDAQEVSINADWGRPLGFGRQILPGESSMDGFYYARITKR